MKIAIIGPVFPYKGGISHYTGLLCRSLKQKHDVTMISYKLQYPKILFRKEQKDYNNDTFKIDDTKYWIHTANPFNWKKTADAINNLAPDLVIIQWWHPYFAPCYYSLIRKLNHTKILFSCHNVFPHERFPFDKILTRTVLKHGDYFIVHSKLDAADLLKIKSDAKFKISVMPTFNAFKFENMNMQTAREELGIPLNQKVLLFFGFVREYKGLGYLLKAMPRIIEALHDVQLLIVGDFGKKKNEYLQMIDAVVMNENINIYDDYIPDREIEKYFAAADLVVLPYISATQSAIVQLAFGFNKPVIVTNVGGLPEAVADGQTGYIVAPQDPDAISAAVIRFFEENKADEFIANVEAEANKYSWDRMSEDVEALCEE